MKFVFDYILQKAPWAIRWMFYLWLAGGSALVAAFTMGWNALPTVNAHIIGVVEEWSKPLMAQRDGQIKEIYIKLDNIATKQNDAAEDIRDIKFVLMSKKP